MELFNNNNIKYLLLILIYFLFLFINLIKSNDNFYLSENKLIYKKYPFYQGDNCTYDYLLIFNSSIGISSITSLNQNEIDSIKVRGGDYPMNNNIVTVFVQSISVPVGTDSIVLSVLTLNNIFETVSFGIDQCLYSVDGLLPIAKNLNIKNEFKVLKSRFLNETQSLIMYCNGLNGYVGFLNTLYFGGVLFKSISIMQKMYETKVLEFQYSFKKDIDDSNIYWVHKSPHDQSIIEFMKFETPIKQSLNSISYKFQSMHPPFGSTLYNSNKTENIFIFFNVSSLDVGIPTIVASFVETTSIMGNDTKSVYPVLGNLQDAQYVAFLNQHLGESLTWHIQTYYGTSNSQSLEFESFQRSVYDPYIPPLIDFSCTSPWLYPFNVGLNQYFITSNSFKNRVDYPMSSYSTVPYGFHVERIKYPFGFGDGNALSFFYYSSDIVSLNSLPKPNLDFQCPSGSVNVKFSTSYTGPTSIPKVNFINYIPMVGQGMKTTIRISVSDTFLGFLNATASPPDSNVVFTAMDLVWGSVFDGVYEKVVDFSLVSPIFSFNVYNQLGNSSEVFVSQSEKDKLIPTPSIGDITVFRFNFNDINLSNDKILCTLYVNYSDANVNYTPGFKLITSAEIARDFKFKKGSYYDLLEWNSDDQLFKLDFWIPSRLFTGNLEYKFRFGNYDLDPITLSSLLVDLDPTYVKIQNNPILSVYSSNADEMPPIVLSITVPSTIVVVPYPNNGSIQFGWDILVGDQINGIESVNITIKSDLDVIGKTFTYFNENNDDQGGGILVPIRDYIYGGICRDQIYRIAEVATRDKNGHYANSTLESHYKNIIDPLIIKVEDISQYDIKIQCKQPVDTTSPVLESFTKNVSIIDIGSQDRYVNVSFSVTDLAGSGINFRNLPYVYVSNSNNQLLSYQVNSTNCANIFKCTFGVVFQLPFMFGYPNPLIISIYGVEDNHFNFGGYSAYIINSKGFSSTIELNIKNQTTPYISSTSKITGEGGDAELFGFWFGLDNFDSVIVHLYYQNNHVKLKTTDFIYHTSRALKFKTIETFFNKLNIGIEVNGIHSNNITILSALQTCPGDCGSFYGGGVCQTNTGNCICLKDKWLGYDCSIPFHYITSVESSNVNGGEARFIGEFSSVHSNLVLLIGTNNCPITYNSSNLIKCNAPPGVGIKNITLTQNDGTYIGINIYRYKSLSLKCPNDCSGNGLCNSETGICQCNTGYGLYDCSTLINNHDGNGNIGGGVNTTIDTNNGSTNINDKQTKFQIYIKQLNEIDINNVIIKSYPLLTDWIFNHTENQIEPNKYIMKQQLLHNNENCIITSIIEEIKDENGKQFQFANIDFKLLFGSIKFTVSIKNYQYQSNLNTLQLEFISEVVDITNNENENCNLKDTQFDSYNNNNQDSSSSFNYIKLSKNNKILMGRFINQVISDSRPTFLTLSTRNDSDSLIVTLNLPHCINECLIDPDFSVLVSSDFKSTCNGNTKNNWIIPVSVVVSVVGFLIIVVSIIMIYKKSTHLKIVLHSFKLKKIIKN